jgi:hypothetical protein
MTSFTATSSTRTRKDQNELIHKPADALLRRLKKDISFALRRGTIARVSTHAIHG